MADSFNIVVIGHGASAHYVASQCHGVEGLRIVATIARPASVARARSFAAGRFAVVSDLAAVPGRVDLVVDCAGHCGLAAMDRQPWPGAST